MRDGPGDRVKFNGERAASMLIDAMALGDVMAADKWQCSERTLRNHRARLATDADFAALFREKKSAADREWSEGLANGIRAGVEFLTRAAQEANPKDPEAIRSVAGGLKILADVAMTSKMLDVRLARFTGAQVPQPGSTGATASTGDESRATDSVH